MQQKHREDGRRAVAGERREDVAGGFVKLLLQHAEQVQRCASLVVDGKRIGLGVEQGNRDIGHHGRTPSSLNIVINLNMVVRNQRDNWNASRNREGPPLVSSAVTVLPGYLRKEIFDLITFLHDSLKNKAAVWVGRVGISTARD